MDKYKIKDLKERLAKETSQEHKNKMLYMWIKQDHISLQEYNNLVINHSDLSNVINWVATSEKLPKEGQEVIVWLPDVKDSDVDMICERTTPEQFKRHYSHWMAYPEPPYR